MTLKRFELAESESAWIETDTGEVFQITRTADGLTLDFEASFLVEDFTDDPDGLHPKPIALRTATAEQL